MAHPRLCVYCKHFEIREGERGYSEYTPGSEVSIGCGLYNAGGHWEMDNMNTSEADFREKLRRADACSSFREFDAPGPDGPQ